MSCKRVGFFFETSEINQRNHLNGLRQNGPHPREAEIIDYLLSGVDAGVAMIVEHDVLKDPPQAIGEATLHSDGEWIWPASLPYYVREYHIALPDEFIATMEQHGWQVPCDATLDPEVPDGHLEM